jgi:valyl-tRNA synthetase
MSKSLGNSIDPLDIIEKYSADSLRFSLMLITSTGMDVYVNMEKFEIGRNFATKVWNAARFMKMHMEKAPGTAWRALAADGLTLAPALLRDDARRLQDGALAIYDFVWSRFCDWYLEYAKQDLNGADDARRRQVLAVMTDVFAKALRLLHPYMPFLTEELWHQLGYAGEKETIMAAPWPSAYTDAQNAAWGLSDEVTAYVDARRELVTAGRALRADYNLAPSKLLRYIVQAVDDATAARLTADAETLKQQLRSDNLEIVAGGGERAMPGTLCKLGTVYLPLEGLVDVKAEAARVQAELDKALGFLKGVEAKLGNEGFVAKAPAAVIEQQRAKQKELTETVARLQKLLATFGG